MRFLRLYINNISINKVWYYYFQSIYFNIIYSYADIAVGAYKSGHVIVLRSKPVVRTNLTVYTVPSTLQRNISNFLIEACIEYHSYDTVSTHGE